MIDQAKNAELIALIGEQAAAENRRAQQLRGRAGIVDVAYVGGLFAATSSPDYYLIGGSLLIVPILAHVPAIRSARKCGRLAAEYLSYQLGFPVKLGRGGMRLRGWRTAINVQIRLHIAKSTGSGQRFFEVVVDQSDPTIHYLHLHGNDSGSRLAAEAVPAPLPAELDVSRETANDMAPIPRLRGPGEPPHVPGL